MNAPSASGGSRREPSWRFATFFAFVPWPIAMPDGYFFVTEHAADASCFEGHPEWLSAFMPVGVANQLAQPGPRGFVAFRLHRILTRLPSPHTHVLEVMRMADAWADRYLVGQALAGQALAGQGHAVADEEAAEPLASHETVIEATTCLMVHSGGTAGKELNAAFDRCLEQFAIFMESYVQTSGDLRSGLVNRSTVLNIVPAVLIDPTIRRTKVTGIQANDGHAFASSAPPELTSVQVEEIGLRVRLAREGEPYITVRHWQRLAHRAFQMDGDFAAAAISCHTAGEVFFDALLLRMAWEEISHVHGSSLTQEEVVGWFTSRSPLSARLRNRYHVRLEGGWDADKPGHPINEWDRKVGRLRNRVVHAGYRPTEREAADALNALKAVETYVLDLIVHDRNRTRYPRTVFMMIGRVGLERNGLYKGKVRKAIETAPADWRRSFYTFLRWISLRLANGNDAAE